MKTIILPTEFDTEPALDQAFELLEAGELVAIPTETVYGLAGHAFDAAAVMKIFAAKQRPSFDPLIVHLAWREGLNLDFLAAAELIRLDAIPADLMPALNALISACWPGPLTLVLPRHARVPDAVTSGLETVALRVPDHPVAQALLARGLPLAAPSANRFGRLSPTSAAAVAAELDGRIPLILDGGPCAIGLESTVIGLVGAELGLLRPGAYARDRLEILAGRPIVPIVAHPAEVRAPGMLKSHYAPQSPLQLARSAAEMAALLEQVPGRPGLLLLRPDPELAARVEKAQGRWVVLSPNGELAMAGRNLFAGLRELDGLEGLIAELPPPGEGLAHAIRDRLFKAAGRG